MTRNALINKLKTNIDSPWDLIIIGGGANGMGVADAALKSGLKILLVEKADFASGASSKSTKLLHGGVRYLEQGNIKLIKESLQERFEVLKEHPDISKKIRIILPVYSYFIGFYYWFGLKLYDWLSGQKSIGKSRWLSKDKTIKSLPNIEPNKLKGGIEYWDGQFDDALMCFKMAKTINDNDGIAINYMKAQSIKESNGDALMNISLVDQITNEQFKVIGKNIVNAGSVEAEKIIEVEKQSIIVSSRGTHIVVDQKFLSTENALLVPKTADGRIVFILPWKNKLMIGTTDTPVNQTKIDPSHTDEDVEYLIETANRFLSQQISKKDIEASFAGLRCLVRSRKKNQNTKDISRNHQIFKSKNGITNVLGGKWTSFKKIGRDTIAFLNYKPESIIKLSYSKIKLDEVPNKIHKRLPYSLEDFRHFIKSGLVENADDLLCRRTRCLFLDLNATKEILDQVINEMALIKNKDEDWKQQQYKRMSIVFEHFSPQNIKNETL